MSAGPLPRSPASGCLQDRVLGVCCGTHYSRSPRLTPRESLSIFCFPAESKFVFAYPFDFRCKPEFKEIDSIAKEIPVQNHKSDRRRSERSRPLLHQTRERFNPTERLGQARLLGMKSLHERAEENLISLATPFPFETYTKSTIGSSRATLS